MNTKQSLVERYRKAKMSGIVLCNMDALALAGYYIDNSVSPVVDLSLDIKRGNIPTYLGNASKAILISVYDKEDVC